MDSVRFNEEICERVRLLRPDGMSQSTLARRLGLQPCSLSFKIHGKRQFTIDELVQISILYRISLDTLVMGEQRASETAAGIARRIDRLSRVDREEILMILRYREEAEERLQMSLSAMKRG